MERKLIHKETTCEPIVMEGFARDVRGWLAEQMDSYKLKYLLAHCDDGVIWGRCEGKDLITGHEVAPRYVPPLREKTLQTARLFAPEGELLTWRDEAGEWKGRLIAEDRAGVPVKWVEAMEEQQILWGTTEGMGARHLERNFTLMSEGTQGLFHVVPINPGPVSEQSRTLRLVVRHYLTADKEVFVRVQASRLVNLLPEPKEDKR